MTLMSLPDDTQPDDMSGATTTDDSANVATVDPAEEAAEPQGQADDILPEGVNADGSPADLVTSHFEEQQKADQISELAIAQQIRDFENQQTIPEHVKKVTDTYDSLRKYVHTDVMMPGVVDGVGTNLVLRNQYVRLGQAYARDPDLTVQPKKLLAPVPAMMGIAAPPMPPPPPGVTPDPAVVAQIQQAAVAAIQDAVLGQFKQYLATLGLFGKTIEFLVKHYADEGGLRDILEGMVQDACTVGIAWCKASWQECMGKDPLGNDRGNDFADTVAKMATLAHQLEEGAFTKDDKRCAELVQLGDAIRAQVVGEHWAQANYQEPQPGANGQTQMGAQDPREIAWKSGNPADRKSISEIPRRREFMLSPRMPEDIRRDWTITDPKQYRKCRWMADRVYMTGQEICEQYGCTLDDIRATGSVGDKGKQADDPRINGVQQSSMPMTTDPVDRESEDKRQINDTFAVWERWDKALNRVFVWVEGCDKYLADDVPTVVSKYWFPYFCLYFNRVTGRFEPMSDVEMQKPLNDAYNLMRTHDQQGRKASYPFYIGSAGSTDETDRAAIRNRVPYSYIELQKPDEVSKHFKEVLGTPYNPALYDTGKIRQDMDEMASVPSAARGSVGDAKFSSEVQVANQQMDVQSDRYRDSVERFLREMFTHMADILVAVLPQANAKAIAGPGAVWPYMDRESLWSNLELDIQAGSAGKPDMQRKLAMWQQFGQICQGLGVGMPGSPERIKALPVIEEIFDDMNIRREASDFVEMIPLPPMPPQLGAPGAGAKSPGPGGPAGPNAQPDPKAPKPSNPVPHHAGPPAQPQV